MANWTTPHTWATSEIATAANLNTHLRDNTQYLYDSRGQLGYSQVVATQGSITSVVDLTGLSVTVTVPAGGRNIKITAQTPWASTVANDRISLNIQEGSTVLQTGFSIGPVMNINQTVIAVAVLVAPSSGSHTYKLTASRSSGTGTITTGAASTNPGFILVEAL